MMTGYVAISAELLPSYIEFQTGIQHFRGWCVGEISLRPCFAVVCIKFWLQDLTVKY